jgi:hypothetical protein
MLDPHSVQAREVEVGLDVPLGVDDRGDAGSGVADKVGGATEVLVDYLSKEHRRRSIPNADYEWIAFDQGNRPRKGRNGS